MAEVPYNVLRLVLERLPIKYILRCKAVSRHWNQLISDPDFIASHLVINSLKPPDLIFHIFSRHFHDNIIRRTSITNGNSVTRQLNFPDEVEELSTSLRGIVGSVQGLVCFDVSGDGIICLYVLWNLATRESRRLPEASLAVRRTRQLFSRFTGFGFDSSQNDYKIVRVISFDDGITSVEVYSRRTDRWRLLEDFPIPNLAIISEDGNEEGVFVGDCLNWIGTGTGLYPQQKVIISFDCRSELFEIIPLEPQITGMGHLKIICYTGSLSVLLCPIIGANPTRLKFWVRKRGNWELFRVRVGFPVHHVPLASWTDKVVVRLTWDAEYEHCAMLYDPTNRVTHNVLTRFERPNDEVQCCKYVESLVPVHARI